MHNAIVSVRKTNFFTEYTLTNIDEELLRFLPGNKILSTGPGHFIFQNSDSVNSSLLMEEIIRAVSEHVQVIS